MGEVRAWRPRRARRSASPRIARNPFRRRRSGGHLGASGGIGLAALTRSRDGEQHRRDKAGGNKQAGYGALRGAPFAKPAI